MTRHVSDMDERLFSDLYDRYHSLLYGYVLSLVKVSEIAEDIVHEIFVRLWTKRQTLAIHTSLEAYVFRMAHNLAIDVVKKAADDRRLRTKILMSMSLRSELQEPLPIELKWHDSLLNEALESLPPQRRRVFQLCRSEHKSYNEVASELGISRNTVKEHMVKAVQSLRSFLQDRGVISTLAMISIIS